MTAPINDFTQQELSFLRSQGISPSEILDGRGMSNPIWKALAKQGGFDFVLAGRCTNGGHRIKTRAGHCIQCRTSAIAFVRRENAKANVYLAAAENRSIIKIGFASYIYAREETLRREGYGGYWDWEILCWVKTPNAGQVEREISNLLSARRIRGQYYKGYDVQDAIEMFSCDANNAVNIFTNYTKNHLGINATISTSFEKM
jgi:hypothetical protein